MGQKNKSDHVIVVGQGMTILLCGEEKTNGIADFVCLAAALQGAGVAWGWNQRGVMREH